MRTLQTEGYARMDHCCNKWMLATYPSTCRRNWALPSHGYKSDQREKGACFCLLPFSVANENDHPQDHPHLLPRENQPGPSTVTSRCDGTAPFAFGIFILRWNSLQYRFCIACRIFLSIYPFCREFARQDDEINSFACIYDNIFRDNRFVSFTVL